MKLGLPLCLLLGACSSGQIDDAAPGSSAGAVTAAAPIASGTIVTFTVQGSGKCIDVPDGSTAAGVQLQQYTCNGTNAQRFTANLNSNGTYTFVNVASKLCIDERSNLATNGDAIQQYTCNASVAQQFTLAASATSGYDIVKTDHGSCLDVTGQSTANSALIQEWGCVGGTNQAFAIKAATTTVTPPPPATKYLSQLGAKCNGSDDTLATIAAVTGARNNAYTLIVDCAATLDIGTNIDRSIFIDNDTTIVMQGSGKFIINNLFEPAFVIANTHDVTLTNWEVEYDASMPVSLNTNEYYIGGVLHTEDNGNGSGQFNDIVLTQWLEKNRGVAFPDGPTHGIWAHWLGSVNVSSTFFIIGDTKTVTVNGLSVYASNLSQPSSYDPFVVMLGVGYKSNTSVTTSSPLATDTNASTAFAVPSNLTFENVTLDGVIMGFQGNTIGATFSNITVKHVSDLQDASGNNIGGVGQNFPPPHLFYLNYAYDGDPALMNSAIKIENVNEVGPRLGGVRPGGGGYADSLKLGCNDCSVNGYNTNRKDGFMDVLSSNGLTVTNVVASYDSSFVDEYEDWPGWRWPGGGNPVWFKNVSFSNVTLTDVAAQTVAAPLSNCASTLNGNIDFTDVNIIMQSWTGGKVTPTFTGLAQNALVTFTAKKQGTTQTLKP